MVMEDIIDQCTIEEAELIFTYLETRIQSLHKMCIGLRSRSGGAFQPACLGSWLHYGWHSLACCLRTALHAERACCARQAVPVMAIQQGAASRGAPPCA